MRSPLGFTLITSVIVLTGLGCAGREPTFTPEIPEIPLLPLGLDPDLVAIPEDNPITPEKVALGWQLFYDTRLSKDETISCASVRTRLRGLAFHTPPRQRQVRDSPSFTKPADVIS